MFKGIEQIIEGFVETIEWNMEGNVFEFDMDNIQSALESADMSISLDKQKEVLAGICNHFKNNGYDIYNGEFYPFDGNFKTLSTNTMAIVKVDVVEYTVKDLINVLKYEMLVTQQDSCTFDALKVLYYIDFLNNTGEINLSFDDIESEEGIKLQKKVIKALLSDMSKEGFLVGEPPIGLYDDNFDKAVIGELFFKKKK